MKNTRNELRRLAGKSDADRVREARSFLLVMIVIGIVGIVIGVVGVVFVLAVR